ncbi:MAG TPA: hypothetical protein VM536_10130 [Chloroflexia bacterium]|nr:hypothetical protein [Chloroflexia bacterium]
MLYFDNDPARHILAPRNFALVATIASDMIDLYSAGGPPFPIKGMLAVLEPVTHIMPLESDGRPLDVYGYAFPLDFARHRKHAALWWDTTAATPEAFLTFFHEAGHVLLHILRDRYVSDWSYDRQVGARENAARDLAEVEADLFARLVTMPAAWVHEHWPYACALTDTPDAAVVWMAELFSVPEGWMALRLRSLGLLR